MIGTFASLTGLGYSLVSGIKTDTQLNKLLQGQQNLEEEIKKLANNIFYAPHLQEVKDTAKRTQRIVTDLGQVKKSLSELQAVTGGNVLSSKMIITPDKMQQIMNKNPWEIFLDIRPIKIATAHSNPEMVPVVFEFDGIRYVGWQMRGVLPSLLNFEYSQSSAPLAVLPPKNQNRWDDNVENLLKKAKQTQDWSKKLSIYEEALAIKKDSSIYRSAAMCALHLQDFVSALHYDQRAVKINPNNVYAWVGIVVAGSYLQHFSLVESAFKEVEMRTDKGSRYYFEAAFYYAKCLLLTGHQDRANSYFHLVAASKFDDNYSLGLREYAQRTLNLKQNPLIKGFFVS